MINNKKDVQAAMRAMRPNAKDYFIPLGGMDIGSTAKREISNLTQTLANHLPLVRGIVDAAAKAGTFYVGYDGRDLADRAGTYLKNMVLLHEAADESSGKFILAYVHELTHLDQDQRGLLRGDEAASSLQFVDFLAHNLMLEAAALATEVTSIYYLSKHSRLADDYEEVADLYDDYIAENKGRESLYFAVQHALDGIAEAGGTVKDIADLKPVWRTVFQQFFTPDSPFLAHYLQSFSQSYIGRLQSGAPLSDKPWGKAADLSAIATIPAMGTMFGAEGAEILGNQIRAVILQDKFMPVIDMTRKMADTIRPPAQDNDRVLGALLRIAGQNPS